MTLTLSPEKEARLRTVAVQRGLAPEEALEVLLDTALTDAEVDFQEASVGIRTGMEDFAAGRSVSLEEFEVQLAAERHTHNPQKANL